jgi:5-methylcytosine-specific restriction endonuclease McrA
MILTCPVCLKPFSRPKAHIRNKTHACSLACSHVLRPKKPKVMVEYTCQECRKTFHRRKGGGGTCTYCSVECRRRNMPSGAAHGRWKGGTSERTHEVRIVIKQRVREVGKCQRCGSVEQLQGHHIKHYSTHPGLRGDPVNIEVLCTNCHALEHPTLANALSSPRKRSGISFPCEQCGTFRYVPPHRIPFAKFCSTACQLATLHNSLRSR